MRQLDVGAGPADTTIEGRLDNIDRRLEQLAVQVNRILELNAGAGPADTAIEGRLDNIDRRLEQLAVQVNRILELMPTVG
jgi:tetrahydromethanopterin S-methyltransferase subunit G